MRKCLFYLSLVTCFFLSQNVEAQDMGCCGAINDNGGCCPQIEQSCGDAAACAQTPEPTGCLPTVCYKPYVYYTSKCHYDKQCCDIQIPCKKKCCRMVPQYYEKTNCRMVPQYYKTTHCRMVPEYYDVDYCKTAKQYYYTCRYTYHPHYFYKKCTTYDNPCDTCGVPSAGGEVPSCSTCN